EPPVETSPVETTPALVDTTPEPAETTMAEPVVTQPVFTDPGYGQDQPVVTSPVVVDPQPVETTGDTDAAPVVEQPVGVVVDVPVEAGPAEGVPGGDPVAEAPATDGPATGDPVDQAPASAPAGEYPEAAAPADTPVVSPVLGTGEVTAAGPSGRVAASWVTVPYRTVVTTTATTARGGRATLPEVTVGTWHDGGVDYAVDGAEGFVAAPQVVRPVVDAAVAAGERLSGVVPRRGDYRVGDQQAGVSVAWDNQPGTASI
ncbi:hypothetical protein ACFWIF_01175, partial [Corynebacterium bovis]